MDISNPILGKVKLKIEATSVTNEGLTVPRLRVELSDIEKPDSAWISELKVIGDLPWHKGEERQVELRVLSDEFRNYVISNKPDLLVKRGSEIIGNLILDKQ